MPQNFMKPSSHTRRTPKVVGEAGALEPSRRPHALLGERLTQNSSSLQKGRSLQSDIAPQPHDQLLASHFVAVPASRHCSSLCFETAHSLLAMLAQSADAQQPITFSCMHTACSCERSKAGPSSQSERFFGLIGNSSPAFARHRACPVDRLTVQNLQALQSAVLLPKQLVKRQVPLLGDLLRSNNLALIAEAGFGNSCVPSMLTESQRNVETLAGKKIQVAAA